VKIKEEDAADAKPLYGKKNVFETLKNVLEIFLL